MDSWKLLCFGFAVNGYFRSGVNYASWIEKFIDKLEECGFIFTGNGNSTHFDFYILDNRSNFLGVLTVRERCQKLCEWFDKESHNSIHQYQLIWL